MDNISLKLDEAFSKKMEKTMKSHDYSTKTEFIREAIRDKMDSLEQSDFEKNLRKYLGFSKTTTSDEQLEAIREKVARDYAKKFGIKLD